MDIALQVVVLIMSVVVHEMSHGYMAYWLGDPTAKYAGRLTFNPAKHLDLFGSIIVPGLLMLTNSHFLFGWAKPVPFNPYNLRNQKWGPALVGLAGPLSNLVMAVLAGVLIKAELAFGVVDGFFLQLLTVVVSINVLLMVFNMFPIPPLDGSKLLFAIIPISEHTQMTLERYGFIFLLIFISLDDFKDVFSLVIDGVLKLIVNNVIGIGLDGFASLMM
jgi:Zn-dependent protease